MEVIDLKGFRKANGITQKELADYLGISNAFISQIEMGDRSLPKNQLSKILLNQMGWDTTELRKVVSDIEPSGKKKIPLYDDITTIGGYNETVANVESNGVSEWVDAGDWFPDATAAIHHYGDSMVEYPSGCILVLKRVNDPRLLINGENYVIETNEFRITKQIQDDGEDYIMAYSSNRETYPDGHLIHSPIKIPKDVIRHLDLVVGCVIKKFGKPARIIK